MLKKMFSCYVKREKTNRMMKKKWNEYFIYFVFHVLKG